MGEQWLTYSTCGMASGLPNRQQRTEKSDEEQGFFCMPFLTQPFLSPPFPATGVRKAKIHGGIHQPKC